MIPYALLRCGGHFADMVLGPFVPLERKVTANRCSNSDNDDVSILMGVVSSMVTMPPPIGHEGSLNRLINMKVM